MPQDSRSTVPAAAGDAPAGRDGDPAHAGEAHAARRIALAAVALGGAALVIAVALFAWRLVAPGTSTCQTAAWDGLPAASALPAGWALGATQYDPDRLSTTLAGPVPQDQTSSRAIVYATVTCYASDAAGAVDRAQAAAEAAGRQVASRSDLGDQAFTALDASGASLIQFRRGAVVTYVVASGDATAADVETIAAAFDAAQGGSAGAAGSPAPVATPAASAGAGASAAPPGSPAPSAGEVASAAPGLPDASAAPSPSAAAPELESALPRTVGGVDLSVDSAVGTAVLGNDAGSRAITAALRAEGRTADELRIAEAYDAAGSSDLAVLAFRVAGMKASVLQKIVMDTWLATNGSGVTATEKKVGDRTVTVVDYGDGGALSYVFSSGGAVFVVQSSDKTLGEAAIAAVR